MKRAALLVCCPILLAGCRPAPPPPEPPVRPVKSIVLQPLGQQPVSFTGAVQPQVSTDYSFQILGRLTSRDVDVGDSVTKGDLLAALDAKVPLQDIQAARAALVGAQASLVNARGVESRQSALLRSNTVAQSVVDDAVQARQSATAAVTQAEAALDKAQEQLGYTRLTAAFDGIVTAVAAEAGQVVSSGQSVLTIARPELRDAVVDLPDRFAAALMPGRPLQVALELDPGITAAGTVREIAPLADPATRSQRVRIALQAPPESFRLGSIVKVALPAGEARAITLPETAILRRGDQSFVWLLPKEGDTVSLRPVRLRQVEGQWVVESGVAPGDRIAAAGVHSLTDGQRVKLEGAAR